MFRRSNGRPPPLLLGALILCILILSYSYWSLNLSNNDTLNNLETLQASYKIGEVKREQNEKKMSALQDTLHDKEEAIMQYKNKLSQQEMDLQVFNKDLRQKEYDISSLKEKLQKLQEKLVLSEDSLLEAQGENERLGKENDMVISQRDDAVNALAKRDEQITSLERKLEKYEALQKETRAGASALAKGNHIVPNIQGVDGNAAKAADLNPQAPINVAPKPIANVDTNNEKMDNEADAVLNQQGVLAQPLKPEEVPVVGDAVQNDHIQAPPLNGAGEMKGPNQWEDLKDVNNVEEELNADDRIKVENEEKNKEKIYGPLIKRNDALDDTKNLKEYPKETKNQDKHDLDLALLRKAD